MIVIPMAGLSSRFTKQGYDRPKYMLPLHGHTVFDYSINSFRSAFETETFLFIALAQPGLEDFLIQHLTSLGVKDFRIEILDKPTRGQAETVALGLERQGVDEKCSLTIFNIDTFNIGGFRPYPPRFPDAVGVLEVFRGSGDNWSFVEPANQNDTRVIRTTEKIPISDLCCTGLYHFATYTDYHRAFEAECAKPQAPELYVAPIYNHLIAEGAIVRYDLVDAGDIIFCGIPEEYEALCSNSHTPCHGLQLKC